MLTFAAVEAGQGKLLLRTDKRCVDPLARMTSISLVPTISPDFSMKLTRDWQTMKELYLLSRQRGHLLALV